MIPDLAALLAHIERTTDHRQIGDPADVEGMAGHVGTLLGAAHATSLYGGTGPLMVARSLSLHSSPYGCEVQMHDPTPAMVAWLREQGATEGGEGATRWLRWVPSRACRVVAFLAVEA